MADKILTLIRTFWPVVIVLLAVAGTAAVNVHRIEDNHSDIAANTACITGDREKQHERDIADVEMRKDIEYIKKFADEQKIEVDNNRVLLEEILERVTH